MAMVSASAGTATGNAWPVPSIEPAWNDRNLHDLAAHISSPRVFAHIRAAIGSPVQQTNCHPFRQGRWLWMHNGFIDGFHAMKRDLALAVDPDRFADMEGTTDSEMLFFLALTFGLEDDPQAQSPGPWVSSRRCTAPWHRAPYAGHLATTDGRPRGPSATPVEGSPGPCSTAPMSPMLKQQYPENPALHELSDDARCCVRALGGTARGLA